MKAIQRLDGKTLKQLKLPPLSQDDKWIEAMTPIMSDDLRVLVARQSALVQEEKQAFNHLIQLKRQKKEALTQLLALTAQLQRNNEEAENQADRIKSLLERINDEMDHLQFRIETTPSEISRLNGEILEETVTLGYDQLLLDHKRVAVLNIKIQALRAELLTLNEEKYSAEDKASVMGQYLHSLLGKELSDEMDAQYGLNDGEYIL